MQKKHLLIQNFPGWAQKAICLCGNFQEYTTKNIHLFRIFQDGLSSGHASDLEEEGEVEQPVPSVLTSQQHQQQKQQQQQQQQHQQQQQNQHPAQFNQNRRPVTNTNSVQMPNNPASNMTNQEGGHLGSGFVGAGGKHGQHGNGQQAGVLNNHTAPGQSSHVSSTQGGHLANQGGHANVLSSLLALSEPQVCADKSIFSGEMIFLTMMFTGVGSLSPSSSLSCP